jgi:hypothetical protein
MVRRAEPLLGTTTDPDKALPGLKSFEVTVCQDPNGYYTRDRWERESRYTKANLPRFQKCKNPRCQQGRVDLQNLVSFSGAGEYKQPVGR